MVCWKDALQMDKLDPEWTQFAVFANHDRVQVDMIRPFVGEDFGYVQELAAPNPLLHGLFWSVETFRQGATLVLPSSFWNAEYISFALS